MACVALSHVSECRLFRCFLATDRAQHKTLNVASRLIKRVYGDALQVLEPFRKVRPMYGGPAYAPDMIETVRGLNFELDE